jgi:WD40 repeat protein
VKLAFASQPVTAMAGDSIHPLVSVAIEDSLGKTVTTATNVVTLAIGTGPGGGTLTGTVSAAPTNGVATFAHLRIDRPGAGYTLTATSPGLTGATSAAFDITPAATQLVFAVQPGNATAGASITPAVQVTVTDGSGETATAFAGNVTVAIGANPGGGTLTGMTMVQAVNGVATFNNLSIQKAGTGYTLTATSGALKGAASAAFAIAPAAPGALSFVVQPSSATAGAALSPAVAVAVRDTFGNTVTGATSAVSVAIGANPGGGTLSGTTTVNAVNGVATFSDISIQKASTASGAYTLTAASGALTGATSASFAIAPAAPAQLGFVVPPSIVDVTLPMFPAVQVAIQDAFGNTVPTASGTVTIALGANPGGATLTGTLTAGTANGVAQFADLALNQLGSGYTLTATSSTLTAATSPSFSVVKQQLIAFVTEDPFGTRRGIGTMHDDGSGVVQLTSSGEAPAWSSDGTRIAFLDNSGVAVMNANGTGIVSSLTSLAPAASGILWNLAWSPDGTKVAFLGDSGVFVMNVDGTGVANILHRSAGPYGTFVNGLAWKPDGSGLVFSGGYDYSTGLFLMAPDGSGVTRILPGLNLYLSPASWSPDGSRLAMGCGSYVCIVNADGTGFAQLASGAQPSWKPDGTRILFAGNSGLSLMNPDGSGVTPLVSTNAAPGYPAWSPDGLRVTMVKFGECLDWSWYSSCLSSTSDTIVVVNSNGSTHVASPAGTEPAWRP